MQVTRNGNGTSTMLQTPLTETGIKALEKQEEEKMIRATGLIPASLNERLKLMARKQGRNADQLIGEMIQRSAGDVDRWEAEQEAARLRERFGDNWIELLKAAAQA